MSISANALLLFSGMIARIVAYQAACGMCDGKHGVLQIVASLLFCGSSENFGVPEDRSICVCTLHVRRATGEGRSHSIEK